MFGNLFFYSYICIIKYDLFKSSINTKKYKMEQLLKSLNSIPSNNFKTVTKENIFDITIIFEGNFNDKGKIIPLNKKMNFSSENSCISWGDDDITDFLGDNGDNFDEVLSSCSIHHGVMEDKMKLKLNLTERYAQLEKMETDLIKEILDVGFVFDKYNSMEDKIQF